MSKQLTFVVFCYHSLTMHFLNLLSTFLTDLQTKSNQTLKKNISYRKPSLLKCLQIPSVSFFFSPSPEIEVTPCQIGASGSPMMWGTTSLENAHATTLKQLVHSVASTPFCIKTMSLALSKTKTSGHINVCNIFRYLLPFMVSWRIIGSRNQFVVKPTPHCKLRPCLDSLNSKWCARFLCCSVVTIVSIHQLSNMEDSHLTIKYY